MNALSEPLERVQQRRKILEVYTDSAETVSEVANQFETRNVDITQSPYAARDGEEFIVIRNADEETQGAVSVSQFRELTHPDVRPPWECGDSVGGIAALFDFLDNTLFTSFDRRQMLAVSREIEDRAWRVGTGTLSVGFQNSAAFLAQSAVYERLADGTDMDIEIYVEDAVVEPVSDRIAIVSDEAAEIGRYWFVAFDGGPDDLSKCGLLAEEREPGLFYGFWTYESELIDELMTYLQTTYGNGG